MQGQSGFAGSLGPVYLHNAPPGDAADAQRQVKGQGAGGQRFHIDGDIVPKAHDGALSVVLFNFRYGRFKGLFFVPAGRGHDCRDLFLFSHYDFSFNMVA